MLLVAMPGALSSDALAPSSFLLLVVRSGAPSGVLLLVAMSFVPSSVLVTVSDRIQNHLFQ